MSKHYLDPAFSAQLIAIARAAGDAILAIYAGDDTAIDIKTDGSPVTQADLAAHRIIVDALHQLWPLPIISEEASWPRAVDRQSWQEYWLVDPLDGTKEFIAGNGEFTVNIALMVGDCPRLGVVHVPLSDESYLGLAAEGEVRAEKYLAGRKVMDLPGSSARQRLAAQQPLRVLLSHRVPGPAMEAFLQQLQACWPVPLEFSRVGSSLKFCWLAEGRGDLYPRLGPTSQWDTAAGQVVVAAAGGLLLDAKALTPLSYSAVDSMLNPWFLALADADVAALIPFAEVVPSN